MGIYSRGKFWWVGLDTNPKTSLPWGKPFSTKIPIKTGDKTLDAENKDLALRKYNETMQQLRHLQHQPPPKAAYPPILFKDYVKEWWDEYGAARSNHDKDKSTINIMVADFGDVLLSDLTAARIDKFRTTRMAVHRVKPQTVNRNCKLLYAILRKADKYIYEHPMMGRNGMGVKKLDRLEEDEFEGRWFTDAEFALFLRTIDQHDVIVDTPRLEGLALAACGVYTLLRSSSLLKLRWSDRRSKGTAKYPFPHWVPRDAKVYTPCVADTPTLQPYMDALYKEQSAAGPVDHKAVIFQSHYRRGTSELDAEPDDETQRAKLIRKAAHAHLTRWFERVCALAGLPVHWDNNGVTPHSWRHTGATQLLANGATVKEVMVAGGWKNADLFMAKYCHADAATVAATMARIFSTTHTHKPRRASATPKRPRPPLRPSAHRKRLDKQLWQ